MNKKIVSILFVLLFLFFIGVMDYPFIARIINERSQAQVIADYERDVKTLSQEEIDHSIKMAEEYNKSLVSGINKQVFPDSFDVEGDGSPYYNTLLNLRGNRVMGSVEIPKIKVKLPIYHTTNDYSLENGVGHVEGSSLPVGGKSTHACLAAHRGLPSKRLFTDLDQIVKGDTFFINVYDRKLAYEVYQVEVVTPDKVDQLLIKEGKDLTTLITCTPYGVNSHRIYVHAYRVPYIEGMEDDYKHGLWDFLKRYWWVLLTILLLIWLVYLLYRFNRKPIRPTKNDE